MHDLLRTLGVPTALECVMLINGAHGSPDRRLVHADSIDVFPPLTGGE